MIMCCYITVYSSVLWQPFVGGGKYVRLSQEPILNLDHAVETLPQDLAMDRSQRSTIGSYPLIAEQW